VYAFCRIADNATDVHQEDTERIPDAARQIDMLRGELADVYADGEVPTRWIALRETVRNYGIPHEYFVELLNGVEMDLTPRRFATFADLEVYCYRVASVVGLIMTHIFGATSSEALRRAAQLGTAMQLTNILRDVGEDHRMGRVYLPQDELHAFGITEEMIGTGQVTPAMVAFLRFQIDRARTLYNEAEQGIPLIPDDGSRFSTRVMSALYARILDAIERNAYDVFGRRAHVPLLTKLRITSRILWRSLTDRMRPIAIRDNERGLQHSAPPDHSSRLTRGH
jgi:phytoene synthase